jgi:hypothetical protein
MSAALIVGALTATPRAQAPAAQDGVVTMDSLKGFTQQYTHVRDMLIKMAELMPEDGYSYQPVPTVRTFASRVGHIASSNLGQCGGFLDKKHPLASQKLEETLKAKGESLEALKASFALCDEFFDTIASRGNLMESTFTVNGRRRDGTAVTLKMGYAGSIAGLLGHNNEMYGYMAMYLRMKGLVPPTSAK